MIYAIGSDVVERGIFAAEISFWVQMSWAKVASMTSNSRSEGTRRQLFSVSVTSRASSCPQSGPRGAGEKCQSFLLGILNKINGRSDRFESAAPTA